METKKSKTVMDKVSVVTPAHGKNGEKATTVKNQKVETQKEEQPLSLSQLLEKQLIEIKRKKQLADRRDVFLAKGTEIEECLSLLSQEQAEGNFTTDNFSLVFARKSGYRDDDAFRISNPALMTKFLTSLQVEITAAVKAIEDELLENL